MKIFTITCHDVYNAGASLQAYALQQYLLSLGHDTKIIDYKPSYLRHYQLWGGAYGKYDMPFVRELYSLAHLPGRFKAQFERRKHNFDLFTKSNLNLTQRQYSSNAELIENLPRADLYFAGSDQIWNTAFKNGRDPAFYLDFAPSRAVKASYAASFATEEVAAEYREVVTKWLESLDFISVRESSGLRILESMGIHSGFLVLDPVFLLPVSEWERMISTKKTKPYIFVCAFEGGDLIKECVTCLANKTGYKIYTMQELGYGDKAFKDAGPIEFLNLIYNAAFVISNSFHATAFSVIFKKQFWVFNRKESINTRMRDLTEMLGISERLVSDKMAFTKHIDDIIDYSSVNENLAPVLTASKNYINKVIRYAEGTDQCHYSGV